MVLLPSGKVTIAGEHTTVCDTYVVVSAAELSTKRMAHPHGWSLFWRCCPTADGEIKNRDKDGSIYCMLFVERQL